MNNIREYIDATWGCFRHYIRDNYQGGVEIKILPYIQDIKNGIFIEAGAHNGRDGSCTKALEYFGWQGVLIEPSVSMYQKCLLHRKCNVENCALVSFDYKEDVIYGLWNGNSMSHVSDKNGHDASAIRARTFTDICNQYNYTHVNLFTLDVEGYEFEVLKGIDFDNIEIDFIIVEINYNHYSFDELNQFMADKGYNYIVNISNYNTTEVPGWGGNHQDFLYSKNPFKEFDNIATIGQTCQH